MSDSDDLDLEIVQEFLIESFENLDQLDRDLVSLEQDPKSRELLRSVFRTIHTIKGTAGFLAFHKLEAITHVGESLLAKLRDGLFDLTPETTGALLRMVDLVRTVLAHIELDNTEGDTDVEPLAVELKTLLDSEVARVAELRKNPPVQVPPDLAIPEAVAVPEAEVAAEPEVTAVPEEETVS